MVYPWSTDQLSLHTAYDDRRHDHLAIIRNWLNCSRTKSIYLCKESISVPKPYMGSWWKGDSGIADQETTAAQSHCDRAAPQDFLGAFWCPRQRNPTARPACESRRTRVASSPVHVRFRTYRNFVGSVRNPPPLGTLGIPFSCVFWDLAGMPNHTTQG
jgi:hypothetical protein